MLRLKPDPTFWAVVPISVPGVAEPVKIECEFVHMTRDEYAVYSSNTAGKPDSELLGTILRNWKGVDAPFSADALATLVSQYHGAAYAIATAYGSELTKARLGN